MTLQAREDYGRIAGSRAMASEVSVNSEGRTVPLSLTTYTNYDLTSGITIGGRSEPLAADFNLNSQFISH